jgi:hypothetical protein
LPEETIVTRRLKLRHLLDVRQTI